VIVSLPALLGLAPRARATYVDALQHATTILPRFGIGSPVRVVHFFAQVLHETAGLTVLVENLHYSPERLMVVWPSRFPTLASAQPYAANPRALANKVYGGRMGNMNAEDGWRFRGRGLLQITGRQNYERVSEVLGLNLTTAPNKALLPEHALSVAACLWHLLGGNTAADTDDIVQVTKTINGGTVGLTDRTAWLARTRTIVREVA
jgi:putative chitinase